MILKLRSGARAAALLCVLLPFSATAQTEKIDYATISRIREEGLQRSQVMDHLSWLADVYGPRMSGTPGMEQAGEWAMKRMREWGLSNVHLEDLGVEILGPRSVASTDHVSFDNNGHSGGPVCVPGRAARRADAAQAGGPADQLANE